MRHLPTRYDGWPVKVDAPKVTVIDVTQVAIALSGLGGTSLALPTANIRLH